MFWGEGWKEKVSDLLICFSPRDFVKLAILSLTMSAILFSEAGTRQSSQFEGRDGYFSREVFTV